MPRTAFIRRRTEGTLALQDAALYQSLRRLERRGWIQSEWRITENNRKSRYYEPTERGRGELARGEVAWRQYVTAVQRDGAAEGGEPMTELATA